MHRPTGAGDQQVDLDAPHPRFLRVLTALPKWAAGQQVPSRRSGVNHVRRRHGTQSAGLSISQMTRCQAEVRPGRLCVTARYRSVLVCHSELTVQQQRLRPGREVAGGLDQSVGGGLCAGVATTGRQYRLGRLRQGMADLLRRSPIGDLQTCWDLRPCDLGWARTCCGDEGCRQVPVALSAAATSKPARRPHPMGS
jgi:hypothetical protein